MRLIPLIISCLVAAGSSLASSLTISIPAVAELPPPHTLPPSTHATLSTLSASSSLGDAAATSRPARPLRARIDKNNAIVFPDLGHGGDGDGATTSYLLEIHARSAVFSPFRVDVAADGTIEGVWDTVRGQRWDHKGIDRVWRRDPQGGVSIDARMVASRVFYEQRPQFSPLSLLKNPMILIGVVALVITVGVPRLLDSIDPEYRAEFEKSRQEMARQRTPATQAAHAAAGFDLASWMAGATSPSVPAGSATATGSGQGQAASGGRQQASAGDARRRR
ncbi:hypothetical protein KEM52_002138 [Ascosphaera acerosa]|nr:hypothetical protein KEM52_002138 [Ascosphaera acerosa]